ncbi:TPA: hypothetical protein I1Q31_001658 [Staphylococcus aureus]|nr:hypothetical protein [Staphylococcus aureus]
MKCLGNDVKRLNYVRRSHICLMYHRNIHVIRTGFDNTYNQMFKKWQEA